MAPKYVALPDVAGIYRTNRWDLSFHFSEDVSTHSFTLTLAEGATVLTPTVAVQRVKVPSSTVVNAQIRASWTTTGTPTSVQGIVMFGRGIDPDA